MYRISFNRSKKTYTIRFYDGKQLISKYRSYPQGNNYTEEWTQNDILNFVRYEPLIAIK